MGLQRCTWERCEGAHVPAQLLGVVDVDAGMRSLHLKSRVNMQIWLDSVSDLNETFAFDYILKQVPGNGVIEPMSQRSSSASSMYMQACDDVAAETR